MPQKIGSYWELVEPFLSKIDIYNGPAEFAAAIADVPRPVVLLYAAHMCLSEVHNGGFLQLFWNNTGVLAPEAAEGFSTIGMLATASLVTKAAVPLGSPFPRDRNDRWDALLVGSGRKAKDLKRIFKKTDNLFIAFEEATETLPFEPINREFWESAKTENGGFQDAATRYARNIYIVQ